MKSKIFTLKDFSLKKYNFKIVIYVLALATIGYLVLTSAMANDLERDSTLQKQLIGIAVGFIFMAVISIIDYHVIIKIAPLIYIGVLLILIAVLIFGVSVSDATRWIKIGGIQFQPSEFAKIGLIVTLSAYFSANKDQISKPSVVLIALAIYGGIAGLIFLEPDLSTTIVTVFIFICLIYVSKISYKWVIGAAGVAITTVTVVIIRAINDTSILLHGYQRNRILSWLFPDKFQSTGLTTQQDNSMLAISSGQLFGKGLNNTSFESVKNGNFLSEENCDFIFAVIGEELGFIGSLVVLVLITLLVIECFRIAYKAKDLEGRLIATGIGALIAFQTFVNISVATGIMPNTGLPLPFISAGVSSLVSIFMGIGLLLNVSLQKKEFEVLM